jgi:hypothetical protein
MASEAELLALAGRVEQASGPGRDLDLEVHAAIDEEAAREIASYRDKDIIMRSLVRHGIFPAYTASLDAAMTLVPAGAGFNLDRYWIREGVRWKVEIATGGIPENPRRVFDCWDAYTAPLAVVEAALKARAATMGGSDD